MLVALRISECFGLNGKVTVRVGKKGETGWLQVTSATHLQTVIAKPPQPTRRRQHS